MGLLVSWFLGFLVSWCLGLLFSFGFKVSWFQMFQSFQVSMIRKNRWCFDEISAPYYQISISPFKEDIDPISKIFENLLDGSAGFVGARLSKIFKNVDVHNFETYNNNILR